jgi:hypothetical protein
MRIFAVFFLLCTLGVFPQPSPKQPKATAPLTNGTVTDNIYHNPQLGIIFKIIQGWVDRSEQTRGAPDHSSTGQVLLAVFEHPPEVKGEGINSAVIIAAESLSAYPDVKTAADYFEPLTEAVTSQGFKVVNGPYQVSVGAKALVRSDFSKQVSTFTMHQSSLVMLSKGHAVSFTFLGGSEDEVDHLIERLSFASTTSVQH